LNLERKAQHGFFTFGVDPDLQHRMFVRVHLGRASIDADMAVFYRLLPGIRIRGAHRGDEV